MLAYTVYFSNTIFHLVQLEINFSCNILIVAAIDGKHIMSLVLRMSVHYAGFHLENSDNISIRVYVGFSGCYSYIYSEVLVTTVETGGILGIHSSVSTHPYQQH